MLDRLNTFCSKKISYFLLLQIISLHGQESSFFKNFFGKTKFDTTYIESHVKDLSITLVGIEKGHDLAITNNNVNKRIIFSANTGPAFGFGLDYKIYTVEFSKAFPAILPPDPAKGKSESYNIRFGLSGHKWLLTSMFQAYQGMYIKNPEELDPTWDVNKDGYPHKNDLGSVALLASLNYIFNKNKYSSLAALWQIDRQLKSAGTWMTGITIRSNALYSGSNVIPDEIYPVIPRDERFRIALNNCIGINIGYGYNYIFRQKYFLSCIFLPGIDLQTSEIIMPNGETKYYERKVGFHGDFRAIGGYNGKHFYGGIHYSIFYLNKVLKSDITMNANTTYLRFFIGKRITFKNKR